MGQDYPCSMTTLVIIDAGNWFKEKEHLHQKYYNECYYE